MHVEFFALIQQYGLLGDAYLSNRYHHSHITHCHTLINHLYYRQQFCVRKQIPTDAQSVTQSSDSKSSIFGPTYMNMVAIEYNYFLENS